MPFPYQETPSAAPAAPSPRIDAILFDYGMVLSGPPDPEAWARLRSITGLDEDSLQASYWAFRHDYDRGALTGTAYWNAVASHAGIKLNADQIAALLAADIDVWTQTNAAMVAWAGRLQRAGIRTGILSNIGDSVAEGVVAKLPWLSGFYHSIWSHALFMAKPEPAIFLKAAEALRTAPANILFIDDRADNIAAAAAIGMQTIHFTNYSDLEREMSERGLAWLLDPAASAAGIITPRDSEPAKK